MILRAQDATDYKVGYGELGGDGSLGFGDLFVSVQDKHYTRALGAHPPSDLVFDLPPQMQSFYAYAALNDSSDTSAVADFFVYADDELVAVAHEVRPWEKPRLLEAELYGARRLRLSISTENWPGCHGVWLDAMTDRMPKDTFVGVMGQIRLSVPDTLPSCDVCFVLVITAGYEAMAETMLGSLWEAGGCRGASVLIISEENNTECQRLAAKFNAHVAYVGCIAGKSFLVKSAVYSVARLIKAQTYIVLDADMIITDSLMPVVAAVSSAPPGNILVCREQSEERNQSILAGIDHGGHPYYGHHGDVAKFGVSNELAAHCPVFNGGVIAATRQAFLGLENAMRDTMPFAAYWERELPDVKWREQGIFNIALARTRRWTELSPVFNCQLAMSTNKVEFLEENRPYATVNGVPAKIIHFNGMPGREHYRHVRSTYRDGLTKPFGQAHIPGHQDILATAARLFRHCYRPTASLAYNAQDAFWEQGEMWAKLWSVVQALHKPRVLELWTFAMSTTVLLMRTAELQQGSFVCLSKSEPPAWLPRIMGDRLKVGDVELLAEELVSQKETYDVICMDTSNNARYTFNAFALAQKLLTPEGRLLLIDVKHPVNDVLTFIEKLRSMGFHDKLLYTSDTAGLYELTLNAAS
ncbi:MAG: NPCBM/NEW2 domain-containing protein [Armatimonadetes bacterium]|nr:NPCBM/NEW2 domain-containing protein [Armatimonadota bacterium]